MADFQKDLIVQHKNEAVFPMPLTDNEYPFWICEYGHTFADKNYCEILTNCPIFRLEYIVSGKGIINSKNYSALVKAGDTYLLHAGDDHIYYSDVNDPLDKIWINFKGVLAKEIIKIYHLENEILFKDFDSSEQIKTMHKILSSSSEPRVLQEESVGYFVKIIHQLSRHHQQSHENIDTVDNMRSYIDLHVSDDISLTDLASRYGFSIDHMIRIFKNKFNITPYQYITKQKMLLARTFLRSTNKSIDEIASELHFSDASHLSQTFFKHFGIRPSEFRKINKQFNPALQRISRKD